MLRVKAHAGVRGELADAVYVVRAVESDCRIAGLDFAPSHPPVAKRALLVRRQRGRNRPLALYHLRWSNPYGVHYHGEDLITANRRRPASHTHRDRIAPNDQASAEDI